MGITLIYTISTDGSPLRGELLTPWMKATLVDFYCNVLIIYLWIFYKEKSWISKIFWLAFLVCLGSLGTATYVLVQVVK